MGNAILLCVLSLLNQEPPLGLTTRAEVVRVLDGDTLEVEVKLKARVRLLDCWAPELRKEGGEESREHLIGLARPGSVVTLHVPAEKLRRLDDVFTFGRILGRVFANGQDVGIRMVMDGFATKEKQ